MTGIKALRSKTRSSGTTTPVGFTDDAPGSSKRNGIRFPREAVKVLREWLSSHEESPYPTEEEKTELEVKTSLTPSQITNWLANARRRRKITERARPRLCASPSLRPSTPAIDIPRPETLGTAWDKLNPLQRWQNSPPENEPASITDIAQAIADSDLAHDQVSTSPSSYSKRRKRSSNGSGFSNNRALSSTSLETGRSSSLSASNSAAFSSHSRGSFGSFNSSLAGKRERRRRRQPAQAAIGKSGVDAKRIFQCTFCTDTFKAKYDWTRHEKSLHLSLEKWICAPLGPIITDPTTGEKKCVYCNVLDPTADHAEVHNHRQCEQKGLDARTFFRKDHLRQHLRLMHDCEMSPFMDSWKSVAVNINSRCGFCGQRFTVWQDRVDHLTAHFKAGSRMAEWKGCRGLDPAVAAQVTNAMPPYLIGVEAVSPVPFSASNRGTTRHNMLMISGEGDAELGPVHNAAYDSNEGHLHAGDLDDFGYKATCWEVLTVRLGKYANDMAKQGVTMTDEMLQAQARRILYDSDDAWNQTAADNPEWLDLFKKAHGLDFIPDQVGGQGSQIPGDLETYGDLGLRIPFAVQLQAYNESSATLAETKCTCDKILGSHTTAVHDERRREDMRSICRILAREGVLHGPSGLCHHMECENNQLAVTSGEQGERFNYRWCTYTLPPKSAQEVARLQAQNSHILQDGEPPTIFSLPAAGAAKIPYSHKLKGRHRYEIPANRAREFETYTAAWQDAGIMPEILQSGATATQSGQQRTSTGAMMEFLGGEIGRSLPFQSDVTTKEIPLPDDFDAWALPEISPQAMADIDRLIAETAIAQADPSNVAAAGDEVPADFAMEDLRFEDLDMDFDGVFDFPVDESFGAA